MVAVVQVSPVLANVVWLAFLWLCFRLWLRRYRRAHPALGGLHGGSVRSSPEGARLLAMMLDPFGWVACRRATLELADLPWIHCRAMVSFDCGALQSPPLGAAAWLPLEVIDKEGAANVDVRESGPEARQVVQRRDQHQLAAEMLATLARLILRDTECSVATSRAIGEIVSSPPSGAYAALRALLCRNDEEATTLTGHPVFLQFAGTFAAGELLVVDLVPERWAVGLTFSYRYRARRSRSTGAGRAGGRERLRLMRSRLRDRLRRLGEMFGCTALGYPIQYLGAFPGREHDWTVLLPTLRRKAIEILTTRVIPPASAGEAPYDARTAAGRLTLRLSQVRKLDDWGSVELVLAPRRGSDLLAGTMFVSMFVSGALAVGAIKPAAVAANREAMTVLLAIVPSLIIPLLWRGEHALVTLMFVGLRRTALVVVAAGFCALAGLIGGLRGSALSLTWAGCFAVAFGGFLVAARANFRPPRLPRADVISGR